MKEKKPWIPTPWEIYMMFCPSKNEPSTDEAIKIRNGVLRQEDPSYGWKSETDWMKDAGRKHIRIERMINGDIFVEGLGWRPYWEMEFLKKNLDWTKVTFIDNRHKEYKRALKFYEIFKEEKLKLLYNRLKEQGKDMGKHVITEEELWNS